GDAGDPGGELGQRDEHAAEEEQHEVEAVGGGQRGEGGEGAGEDHAEPAEGGGGEQHGGAGEGEVGAVEAVAEEQRLDEEDEELQHLDGEDADDLGGEESRSA